MNMHNFWVSKNLPVSRSGAALVSMFWFGEPLATPEIHKYIFFSVKVSSTLYSKLLLNLFFFISSVEHQNTWELMLPAITMETEASHMLEAALEQMDDIIAGKG